MFSILCAIISRAGFSLLSVYWKILRNKGVKTRSVIALNGLIVLPWVPVAAYWLIHQYFELSPLYLMYTMGWLSVIFATHFLSVYLYKDQGLTASESFRTLFASLLALGLDVFVFKQAFSSMLTIGCICLLISGLTLQFHRTKNALSLSLKGVLGILALNALVGTTSVAEIAFFKASLDLIGNDAFSHFLWTTSVMGIAYILWGGSSLLNDIRQKHVHVKMIFLIMAVSTTSLIAYAYAVNALPLLVIVLVRVVASCVFAGFDLKLKEFHLNKKTIVALIGVLIGLVLITIEKMD